ncbi:MAG: hypothetical protein QNJ41_15500 [Xenococcaceae cyanobacterium MO_188.B32]|nr:hypothetical protein [Xenococcaceae cyanobacterium MO_188.B32]
MDLKARLNKAVVGCGLRDILTQHGIPQDEVVKISIRDSNGKTVVSTDVPTSIGKVMTNQTSNLREDVVDFLNRADAMFELVSELPKSSTSINSKTDGVEQTEAIYQIAFDCGNIKSIVTDVSQISSNMPENPLATIIVVFNVCKPCGNRPCCAC